ncbi:Hypothetical predicted protein, partial [Pelobates cultripes]
IAEERRQKGGNETVQTGEPHKRPEAISSQRSGNIPQSDPESPPYRDRGRNQRPYE